MLLTRRRSHHYLPLPIYLVLDAVHRPSVTASLGSVSTAAALQPSSNVGVVFSCAKKKGARIFGADNQLSCVVVRIIKVIIIAARHPAIVASEEDEGI